MYNLVSNWLAVKPSKTETTSPSSYFNLTKFVTPIFQIIAPYCDLVISNKHIDRFPRHSLAPAINSKNDHFDAV